MGKTLLFLISFLGISYLGVMGQNIVPNPSFENYSSCPTSAQQWARVSNWINPTGASPDYFNSCSGTFVGVPTNWCGNQAARTGNGYGRMLDYGYNTNYREYIQVPLSSPMVAGTVYNIEYFVSLCDNQQIGHTGPEMRISTGPISSFGTAPLPYTPHVKHTSVITDKSGWTRISGTYTATGGENYATIGVFTNDAGLATTSGLGGSWSSSSYYIEDVSIAPSVILNPAALPFSARPHIHESVQLEWDLSQLGDVSFLTVEKGTDGTTFKNLATYDAPTSADILDQEPALGQNFYRIKAVLADGETFISQTVNVTFDELGANPIAISPNPVNGNEFQIHLPAYVEGEVQLEIAGISGNTLYRQSFETGPGQSILEVQPSQKLPKGVYFAQVSNRTGLIGVQRMIIR